MLVLPEFLSGLTYFSMLLGVRLRLSDALHEVLLLIGVSLVPLHVKADLLLHLARCSFEGERLDAAIIIM